MVPTAEELEEMRRDSMPTKATDRISEGVDAVDAAVSEASPAEPESMATEVAVKETEAPSVHSEVPEIGTEAPVNTEEPITETEASSVNNEAPEEQTEAPSSAHTESPAVMPETTVGPVETTAENTVAEGTLATEGTPNIEPETTDNAETSETELIGTEFKEGADHMYKPETEDVDVEDSEGEILTLDYIYNTQQMLLSRATELYHVRYTYVIRLVMMFRNLSFSFSL